MAQDAGSFFSTVIVRGIRVDDGLFYDDHFCTVLWCVRGDQSLYHGSCAQTRKMSIRKK